MEKRDEEKDPSSLGPSKYELIFDTETTVDAAQQLRFGTYQLREAGEIQEEGFFYDPESLSTGELRVLKEYAESDSDRQLEVILVSDFIKRLFYPGVYESDALCIGFNLPFDISRLAIQPPTNRGPGARDRFIFCLSKDKKWPRIRVQHLNSRAALIDFAAVSEKIQPLGTRRGYFLDVRTLAGALLSGGWSLHRLSHELDVEHKKEESERHGEAITFEYLEYAFTDVEATWDCYESLRETYEGYGLEAPITKLFSEASLGKAYLRQMNVRPWKKDLPPDLVGQIMSSYYGGRAEVHVRRQIIRVLYTDFTSMYPSVNVLMDLWRFVTADGVDCEDATDEVQHWLDIVTLADLQKADTWPQLRVLVQLRPDADILPVRADYAPPGS
jgi:hypothetical protein